MRAEESGNQGAEGARTRDHITTGDATPTMCDVEVKDGVRFEERLPNDAGTLDETQSDKRSATETMHRHGAVNNGNAVLRTPSRRGHGKTDARCSMRYTANYGQRLDGMARLPQRRHAAQPRRKGRGARGTSAVIVSYKTMSGRLQPRVVRVTTRAH